MYQSSSALTRVRSSVVFNNTTRLQKMSSNKTEKVKKNEKKRTHMEALLSPLKRDKPGKATASHQFGSSAFAPVESSMDSDTIMVNTDEEIKDEVVGNLEDEQIQNLHTTYASVAGSASDTPMVDKKNVLYIQNGHIRREPITKALFGAFMAWLQSTIIEISERPVVELDPDENLLWVPDLAWSSHHLGRGIVACNDEKTTAWVKTQAESFNSEGKTIRAWSRNEFGCQVVYQGFLHSTAWLDKKWTGPKICAWIFKINNLKDTGKFQVMLFKKVINGVFLRFEADKTLEEALDKTNYSLKAGICRWVLSKKVINNSASPNVENSGHSNNAEEAENQNREN